MPGTEDQCWHGWSVRCDGMWGKHGQICCVSVLLNLVWCLTMHARVLVTSPVHVHRFTLARSVMARAMVMAVSVSRLRSRTTMIAIKLTTMVAPVDDEMKELIVFCVHKWALIFVDMYIVVVRLSIKWCVPLSRDGYNDSHFNCQHLQNYQSVLFNSNYYANSLNWPLKLKQYLIQCCYHGADYDEMYKISIVCILYLITW